MYAIQNCMGWKRRVGPTKRGPEGPLSIRPWGRASGEADHGGRDHQAERHEHDRDEAIEQPFELGKGDERHDTHLFSWIPRGSGGVLI